MKARELPPKNDPAKIETFLDTVFDHTNTYRIDRMSLWEQCRLYKQGDQHIEPDFDASDVAGRTPFFKQIEAVEGSYDPMPVHNEIIAPIQNEVARLEGNGSRPYIRAADDTPRLQRAAKLARDVLNHTLEALHWREIEHEGCDQMVTFGTWFLKSYWDIDYTKTFRAPLTTAVKCPNCDFVLADPSIPKRHLLGHAEDPRLAGRLDVREEMDEENPVESTVVSAKATRCLTCDEEPPTLTGLDPVTEQPIMTPGRPAPALQPYIPSTDEAKGARDHFGRSLGEDLPLGDIGLENVSPFDMVLENHGLDIGWQNVTEFAEERVRSLDWIANHYPQNADQVQAMTPAEMMRWHPIVGASRYVNGGGEPGMFANHALVREFHKRPWVEVKGGRPRKNRGRSIVMAGNVVLLDGDFLIDCLDDEGNPTGETIDRVHYEVIPWEIKEKEALGLSMAELLLSPQDSVNDLIAQVQDIRFHFGNPKVFAKEGMDVGFRVAQEASSSYPSDIYYYRSETDEQPIPFGNQQMGAEWNKEYDVYRMSIQSTAGTMDVEIGNVPKDVTAASAMMFMGEKASERRKNRLDRIKEAKKRTYRHMLQMIQEKYREDREYVKETASNRRTTRTFKGPDLLNQCNVEFDDEPAYDTKMFRREAIKEAIAAGTIVVDTAVTKRKINRELGAPLDINEEQNKQVERAIDEWLGYFEDGVVPAVSVRGDDHTIHAQQHMLDLMGDDATKIQDDLDWNQIELALWGWEEDFDMIMAAEADLKMNPPGAAPPKAVGPTSPPDPKTGAPGVPMGPASPEDQAAEDAQWQMRVQQQQQIAAMPRALELRIYEFQKGMLDAAGILTTPDSMTGAPMVDQARTEGVLKILRFRAHAEAHFRTAEKLAMKAQAGLMTPAAPGGVETATGSIPAGPRGAKPGAGSGMGAATASGSAGMPA